MPVRAQQRVILASTTALPVVPLDIHDANSQVSWAVSLDGNGSVAYKIQFTLDNVLNSAVSAVFYDSVSAQTTTNVGNITVPVAGIRCNFTTVSASSNAPFRVLQSGGRV